jgi:DNA-binding NarL/FixJ family response regulator
VKTTTVTGDTERIKVAIIEDQAVIREGLAFLISTDDNFTVDSYRTAEEALEGFRKNLPEVVLMDIGLPGMNGIEATQIITAKYPAVRIMMCTVYEDDEKIFKALAAGASGYVLKKSSPALLLSSIREIHRGGAPMSSQIARKLVDFFQKPKTIVKENPLEELTKRENEVMQLLSEGFSYKDIAEKLFLSISTIRSHIYNIYLKLHVRSRTQAINKLRSLRQR